MKNENYNKMQSLDDYFNLAKKEKVEFSKEDAKHLITNFSAASTTGIATFWSLKSLLNIKMISISSLSLILFSAAVYFSITQTSNPTFIKNTSINATRMLSVNNNNNDLMKIVNKNNIPVTTNYSNSKSNTINNNDLITINISDADNNNKVNKIYKSNIFFNSNHDISNSDNIIIENIPNFGDYHNNKKYGMQTFFDDVLVHSSYSAVGVTKITTLAGRNAQLTGGRIGWVVNKDFTIALVGYGLTANNFTFDYPDLNNNLYKVKMNYGYGGIFCEYTFNPYNRIHIGINTTLALGGFELKSPDESLVDKQYKPWAAFVVVEPGISAEINLVKGFSIGLEGSYRYSSVFQMNDEQYVHNRNFNNISLNGFTGGIYVKFTLF